MRCPKVRITNILPQQYVVGFSISSEFVQVAEATYAMQVQMVTSGYSGLVYTKVGASQFDFHKM